MKSIRMNAAVVGGLFIIGTLTGVMSAAIESPILGASDYLLKISTHAAQVTIGAFLQFLMAVACAGIGLSLFPIMKKYSEGQAMAVAGFRVIEGTLDVLGGIATISLLALSQAVGKAGAADPLVFQTIGAVIKAGSDWLSNGAMLLPWCIAALMYYSVFFQYRLVPGWLSVWGLVGIVLTILWSVVSMLNILPAASTVQVAVNLPIAVQEMVFALWLIVKGINPSPMDYPSYTPSSAQGREVVHL